eukprot:8302561-Alexandrium_andersonii.AAC.1
MVSTLTPACCLQRLGLGALLDDLRVVGPDVPGRDAAPGQGRAQPHEGMAETAAAAHRACAEAISGQRIAIAKRGETYEEAFD